MYFSPNFTPGSEHTEGIMKMLIKYFSVGTLIFLKWINKFGNVDQNPAIIQEMLQDNHKNSNEIIKRDILIPKRRKAVEAFEVTSAVQEVRILIGKQHRYK